MRYCKRCVQPDTRPRVYFDENGICAACLSQEEVGKVDWEARQTELNEIVKWAKSKKDSPYDCVIGVSGGKDSTITSLYSKDILGLHPLLVNGEPENISDIGRHNVENLKKLGFDFISLRPNPITIKKLIKRDFYRYLNPVKVTEYSLWASSYIIAHALKIPLIVQGDNAGLALGIRYKTGEDDEPINNINRPTLEKDCLSEYSGDGVAPRDLFMFHWPKKILENEGVREIWLQYYLKEYSQPWNAAFSMAYGLKIKPDNIDLHDIGTYRRFSQLDSELVQVNQMLKHIKFGFGQATDHACYDIRDKLITKEEGIAIIKEFDGKCGEQYIKMFCDYIEISVDEFWRVANNFRGEMWEKDENENWKLKNPIWEQDSFIDIDTNKIVQNLDHFLEKDVVNKKRWFESLKSQQQAS